LFHISELSMDRLKAMTVFVAVVEAKGFAAAARRLGMPIATVSRRVSELEEHLNARLLVRTTRKIALTDTGLQFFETCRRLIEEFGEAERIARGEFARPEGDLTLTAPIVFGRLHVVPLVSEFLRTYPEVNVRLLLGDRSIDLIEEHVDAAVRIGELPRSSLVATRLGAVRQVICASPAYLEKLGAPQHPKELAQRDCIMFSGLFSGEKWTFRVGKRLVPFPVRSRLVVTTAEAAIDAAIAGSGLTAVLSYQVAEPLRAKRLKIVLDSYKPADLPVSLVRSGGRLVPAKLRAFIEFAAPRLRARLADL
jgi:DNA-binding transcriptional LysR family regulator